MDKAKDLQNPSQKICTTCKEIKHRNAFSTSTSRPDGLYVYCKDCANARNRKLYHERKFPSQEVFEKVISKDCKQCGKNKPSTEFRQNKKSIDGLSYYCSVCKPLKLPVYNPEKCKERAKRYWERHPEKLKEKYIRMGKNINRRVRTALNRRMSECLKFFNLNKNEKTIDLIGCSIPFFKEWLEFQFLDGMSWDNYGRNGWHIDHVRPCSSYNLSKNEEIYKCFNWKNLQPLWEIDNLKKSGKVDLTLIENHENKAMQFELSRLK